MKNYSFYFLILILLSGCTFTTDDNSKKEIKELRNEVIETETAFAKTMADRNFNNFKAFISDEAIFFDDDSQLNGKTEILENWKKYFNKEKASFHWEPKQVDVLQSGLLAHSSGKVYNTKGKQTGYFNSIWRLEGTKWKIIFDKGYPFCSSE